SRAQTTHEHAPHQVPMKMKSRRSLVLGSCAVIAAVRGADAFVPPTGGIAKAHSYSSHVHGSSTSTSSRRVVTGRVRSARPRRTGRQLQQDVLMAQMTDEEMALDQALIQRVTEEVEAESGVELDQLINPAKVINLERDLVKLRAALEDGPGGDRKAIEEEIAKKESTLVKEKRMYMQGWLKKVFIGQAVITTILGGLMASDQVPFFPHVDISIQVLGFWFVWLFTVPSLRARKPGASEKVALDIAFLATPVVSFAMPFATKDPVPIYWANIATLVACYGYGFTVGKPDDGGSSSSKNQPKWLKFIFKSLDFGSGQERGVRGAARDRLMEEKQEKQEQEQSQD
ncbi:unnamed protein product, partial [Ectocarpus fasciculatus]